MPANNVNYWIPLSGSPALSGSSFANPNLNGFDIVSYRGAFGNSNWTSEWAQFNPKNYEVIGINQISSIVPDKFTLSQNYPNPFNPTTNLEFGIPASQGESKLGFVSLKVYDVLGKEVASLVNGNLNPGIYKYDFDASGLTSGIYFYTLKVNEFSETKRMMLLK